MKKVMLPRFILRAIKDNDLEDVIKLGKLAKPGLTSLTKDKKVLSQMVQNSLKAFSDTSKKTNRSYSYFFVLEDTHKKRVIGTSRIMVTTGHPFTHHSFKKQKVQKKHYRF